MVMEMGIRIVEPEGRSVKAVAAGYVENTLVGYSRKDVGETEELQRASFGFSRRKGLAELGAIHEPEFLDCFWVELHVSNDIRRGP